MLTNQHYVKVAALLREALKNNPSLERQHAVFEIAHRLGEVYHEDNPNFDIVRFMEHVHKI